MNYYLIFYLPPLYSRLHLTPAVKQKKMPVNFPPKCLQTHFRGETETAPIACHRDGRRNRRQRRQPKTSVGERRQAPRHWREPRKTRVRNPPGDIWVLNQKSGENHQKRWFIMEIPIKLDYLEVPPFLETPIWSLWLWNQKKRCVCGNSMNLLVCTEKFWRSAIVYWTCRFQGSPNSEQV